MLRRKSVVPGNEFALDRVGAASRGRSEHASLGTEEVHIDLFEVGLRRIEYRDQLSGLRISMDRSRQLHMRAIAIGGEDQAVRFTGLGFTEVERSGDRPWKGSDVEFQRPNLGVVRAPCRSEGANCRFRFVAGRLAV